MIYARDNNVSAVVFNGDTVEKGTQANYDILDGIFTEVFGSPSAEGIPEFVFNMGNHEFYVEAGDMVYATQVGYYETFATKWSRNTVSDNVYYRVIDGVYYIVAYPGNTGDADATEGYFSTSDISKIEDALEYIVGTGTNKPIVLLTHWYLGKTYGGDYDALTGTYRTRFTNLLADYPQVIHVTGHSHFSALHDRALEQDNYTTINVGQFAYDYFVSGLETDENGSTLTYDNISELRADATLDPVSDGLDRSKYFGLMFGYTSDNLFIRRVDIADRQIETRGWTIPYGINSSNKSSKFYYEDSERSGTLLHFGKDTALTGYKNVSGDLVMVSFRDVDEFRECEGYRIVIKNGNGTTLKTVYWMSRFWAGLDEKSEYYVPLSGVTRSESYKIDIYAINHFGEYSNVYSDARFVIDYRYTKEMFVSGVNYVHSEDDADEYSVIIFDYKIINDGEFDLCILDEDQTNYYGYFTFTADGEKSDYAGVSCTDPDSEGWITVTITIADVTVHSKTEPTETKILRIRGRTSDATGWIFNIWFE